MGKIYVIRKIIMIAICISLAVACIEEYEPNIINYSEVLVVEALLTDNPADNFVKLSVTVENENDTIRFLSGAKVEIREELGNITELYENKNGLYLIDSNLFKATSGRIYTLKIETTNGKIYESKPCLLEKAPSLTNVYADTAIVIDDLQNTEQKLLQVYVDGNSEQNSSKYLRWAYEEYWEYQSQYSMVLNQVQDYNYEWELFGGRKCWKSNKSKEILIRSFENDQNISFKSQNILSILPQESDRFVWEYAIVAKQYSISKEEYKFWEGLYELGENTGDIFEKQPYSLKSNITCISNIEEPVLGYFSVSGISKKILRMTSNDLQAFRLPRGTASCNSYVQEMPVPYDSIVKKELYESKVFGGWKCVEIIRTPMGGREIGLGFAMPECVDCSLIANPNKPDFW